MRRGNEDGWDLNKQNRFLAIFTLFLLAYSMIASGSTIPRSKERFFQLYVLGETGKAERYYPKNEGVIPLNAQVKWCVGIVNSMDSPQLIALKVKMGNSTSNPPDGGRVIPGSLPTLLEYQRVLSTDETWEFPFIWSAKEIRVLGNMTYIIGLVINNVTVTTSDVIAENGRNYRLIFELWSFDVYEEMFVFGWRVDQERRCAWLQLWFNVTTAGEL